MRKVVVPVVVHIDEKGRITPLSLEWEDGTVYQIDRILQVERAVAQQVGGAGIRYTGRVLGRERYLDHDDLEGTWFVEGR